MFTPPLFQRLDRESCRDLFFPVRRTREVARKGAELDTICNFKHAHG